MIKCFLHSFFILFLFFTISVSCKTKKRIQEKIPHQSAVQTENFASLLAQFLSYKPTPLPYQCSGSISITTNENTISSVIRYSADCGQSIMISLRPIPLMEVGRLYFYPSSILFINKVDGVFVEASYQELSNLLGTSLSYQLLESLLMAYIPSDYNIVSASTTSNNSFQAEFDGLKLNYFFHTGADRPSRIIITSDIYPQKLFTVEYNNYLESSKGKLPQHITFLYDNTQKTGLSLEDKGSVEMKLIPTDATAITIRHQLQRPSTTQYRRLSLFDFLSSLGIASF